MAGRLQNKPSASVPQARTESHGGAPSRQPREPDSTSESSRSLRLSDSECGGGRLSPGRSLSIRLTAALCYQCHFPIQPACQSPPVPASVGLDLRPQRKSKSKSQHFEICKKWCGTSGTILHCQGRVVANAHNKVSPRRVHGPAPSRNASASVAHSVRPSLRH